MSLESMMRNLLKFVAQGRCFTLYSSVPFKVVCYLSITIASKSLPLVDFREKTMFYPHTCPGITKCVEVAVSAQVFSSLPRSSVSKYNTWHCRDLQIPRYRIEFAKKGFHYSALKAWNDIPVELRELPTLNSFRKQLKTYLKG